MSYLNLCATIISRLPLWENLQRNNEQCEQINEKIARYYRLVVSELAQLSSNEGRVFGQAQVNEWLSQLNLHCRNTNGRFGFSEALAEFKMQFGWILGCGASHLPQLPSQPFIGFGMATGHLPSRQLY